MLFSRRNSIKILLISFFLLVLYFLYKLFFLKFNLESLGFSKVASLTDLKNNNFFKISDRKIIIKNNDSYYMLNLVCPHKGCIVKYINKNNNFVCPCHASIFLIDGKFVPGSGPSNKDLETIFLFTFNGDLYS